MKPQHYQLPEAVAQALTRSENFRVQTMDGTGWIDPYTAEIVPAPFGWEEMARRHLLRTRPWVKSKPKPLRELVLKRWSTYLRDNLQFMPVLRIFRSGMWLNPYTGEWRPGVRLVNNQVTERVADQLAEILCACPKAQAGKMLEKVELETLAAQGPSDTTPVARPLSGPVAKPLTPKGGKPAKAAAAAPAQTKAATKPQVARPLQAPKSDQRGKTDFHHLRRMFAKMLVRPPRVDHQQIVVHYEPHAPIARDFYDFIKVGPNHLLIVLGNFNGRGPGAAMMAGTALSGLRSCAREFSGLEEYVARLNDEIRCDLYHGSSISLFAALLDLERNVLTCLSAGHRPILHISPHAQNVITQVRTNGASLGVLTGPLFRDSLETETITMADGDIVLFVSDGVFRTINPDDPDAGRCAILGNLLANLDKPLAKLVKDVLDEAKRPDQAPVEDMTMVAMRAKATPWLFRMEE
jgi:hypothetical protein